MGRLALVAALLYAARAEPSAFEIVTLLQSMPFPSEDAVSLQGGNRSIGEIFAFPPGMTAAIERRRSNSTRKSGDYASWPQVIDELLDNAKSDELSGMMFDITHDFNVFYKEVMRITQKLMLRFENHLMSTNHVKDWMKQHFTLIVNFAAAAHSHIMKVVEDMVDAKKKDEAVEDGNLWDWGDEADTGAELAELLKDLVDHIEKPMTDVLIVYGSMQANLFDITKFQFCKQAVTALQCLVNLSTMVDVEFEQVAAKINQMVHIYDTAKHHLDKWSKGVHDKLGTEVVLGAEMFFESVKSWVKYVNATVGGVIAYSMSCPLTYTPDLTGPVTVKKHSEAAKP